MKTKKQKTTRIRHLPLMPEPTSSSSSWLAHEAICPCPELLVPPDDNPRRFKILPGLRCMAIADYLRLQLPSLTRAIYFGRIQSQAVQYFNRAVNVECGTKIPLQSTALLDWLSNHPWSIWYRNEYSRRYGLKYTRRSTKADEQTIALTVTTEVATTETTT